MYVLHGCGLQPVCAWRLDRKAAVILPRPSKLTSLFFPPYFVAQLVLSGVLAENGLISLKEFVCNAVQSRVYVGRGGQGRQRRCVRTSPHRPLRGGNLNVHRTFVAPPPWSFVRVLQWQRQPHLHHCGVSCGVTASARRPDRQPRQHRAGCRRRRHGARCAHGPRRSARAAGGCLHVRCAASAPRPRWTIARFVDGPRLRRRRAPGLRRPRGWGKLLRRWWCWGRRCWRLRLQQCVPWTRRAQGRHAQLGAHCVAKPVPGLPMDDQSPVRVAAGVQLPVSRASGEILWGVGCPCGDVCPLRPAPCWFFACPMVCGRAV